MGPESPHRRLKLNHLSNLENISVGQGSRRMESANQSPLGNRLPHSHGTIAFKAGSDARSRTSHPLIGRGLTLLPPWPRAASAMRETRWLSGLREQVGQVRHKAG